MLYTNQSIRFTASEIAAYRAKGVEVAQIKTYRQFAQIADRQTRIHRKEKDKMAKRFGRRALNGTMEYYDSYEDLLVSQRRDNERARIALCGAIGLIAGGVLAYALLRWVHVDSRVVRFVAVIAGVWIGCTLGASLSALLWTILKWTVLLMVIAVIGLFIFLVV